MHGGGVREMEMKKLILPELKQNNDLPDKMSQKEFEEMLDERHFKFVPEFEFEADGLSLIPATDYDNKGEYMYAYIVGGEATYYDNALVKTDDFHFRTYAGWKKAVKDMTAQLIKRWKEWVRGLYEA